MSWRVDFGMVPSKSCKMSMKLHYVLWDKVPLSRRVHQRSERCYGVQVSCPYLDWIEMHTNVFFNSKNIRFNVPMITPVFVFFDNDKMSSICSYCHERSEISCILDWTSCGETDFSDLAIVVYKIHIDTKNQCNIWIITYV